MTGIQRIDRLPQKLVLPPSATKLEFEDFLSRSWELGISDLTIQSGDPVWGELDRQMVTVTDRDLEHSEVEQILLNTYGPSASGLVSSGRDANYAYEVYRKGEESKRFRCNAVRCRVGTIADGYSMTFRRIPGIPPPFASLGVPAAIENNYFVRYGLVLVVGTTGSGKSTLLASGNRWRLEFGDPVKIIEYAQPIEFTYGSLGRGRMPSPSLVEVGESSHLKEWGQTGPNALRRAPKVIVMGELRDKESIDAGFEMALTGHATYATLHVDTPAEVFDRVISYFPVQAAAANKLLSVLRLVVAQKLAVLTDGSVKAYRSWLVVDTATRRELQRMPYQEWSARIHEICESRGADFQSQAGADVISGMLSLASFREVTGMAAEETDIYIEQLRARAQREAA